MAWQPILEVAERDCARTYLEGARSTLLGRFDFSHAPDPEVTSATLSAGLPGIALAQAYVGFALDDPELVEASTHTLEAALGVVEALGGALGLVRGIAGVGFVIQQLATLQLVDDELCTVVDDVLRDALDGDTRFDLTCGLAGWLVYALERPARSLAHELVPRIAQRLAAMAEPCGGWRTLHGSHDFLDLGVAHGAFDAACALAAARAPGVEHTIDAALELANRHRDHDGRMPAIADHPGLCYGDPGAAAIAFFARRAIGDDRGVARELDLVRAAARAPLVIERGPGLRHGTAGVAHAFNRIYQVTGDPELRDAALRSLSATLDLAVPTPGLFDGLAGTSLAVVAAISARPPSWDRVFLLGG